MAKQKKTDEQILFSDVKVGDYTVKPWNFGVLFDISEKLERVIEKAEAKGIDKQWEESGDFLPYTVILKLFTLCSQEVLETIAITLDVEVEEVKQLGMSTGIQLATTIFKQNSVIIKNSLAPLFEVTKEEREMEENENEKEQV